MEVLAGLIEVGLHPPEAGCVQCENARRTAAQILAAGWRPPQPDSETEWGYRIPDGFVSLEPSEAMARRWVDMAFPGQRVLVRREVGPWIEVQP